MKTITRLSLASLAAISGLLFASTPAHAADSTRGPFYVQASPIGAATITYAQVCFHSSLINQDICGSGGSGGAYRAAVEFGYHFSGRHDGFALGVRQTFLINGGSLGITQARLGWDIPIPIKDFELVIAPYGVIGVAYAFSNNGNGSVGVAFGAGVEGRFFFMKSDASAKGLYAFAQPIEVGGMVAGPFGGFTYMAGLGIGYAF
jgi:hypothetical protein